MSDRVDRWKGKRTGCLYSEWWNDGRHGYHGELHNQGVPTKRLRWVAEFRYFGKRYRFRSTNFCNAWQWRQKMADKLNA